MRSSFTAFHDEIRPLHLLDEQQRDPHVPDRSFLGAVLAVLALVVPVLLAVAL